MRWLDRLRAAFTRASNIQKKTRFEECVIPWSDALIGCCDCGLMHRATFRLNERGQLTVRMVRDEATTIAVRRDRADEFSYVRVQRLKTVQS